jgi:pyruvate, water dikinase
MGNYILNFSEISNRDLNKVGGKNASLGEMFNRLKQENIEVPDGFATTAEGYWLFLEENNLKLKIYKLFNKLDKKSFHNLESVGSSIRQEIMNAKIPQILIDELNDAYFHLLKRNNHTGNVAVRSSATAEDLPTASFAGQLETFLNIKGEDELIEAFHKCLASLYTNRAIKYRIDNKFEHSEVALSVGVQLMVRADRGSSGVAFTLEPDTGFRDVIVINGAWGLGENVVQGKINPDEFIVFKPVLKEGKRAVISSKLGEKQLMMTLLKKPGKEGEMVKNKKTPARMRNQYVLAEKEIIQLAHWCLKIEEHYQRPMDIEWAKDGITGKIYIVQARPETVHTQKDPYHFETYKLKSKGELLTTGLALGQKIASGNARILKSPSEAKKLKEGEVLITDITNPDWDPIMKKAAAIVTNKGGRTSHAAIVAREIGVVAVVGTGNATSKIKDGSEITVSCAEGKTGNIYKGKLDWEVEQINTHNVKLPETQMMLILGDPDKAFKYSFLPNNGIGLMRLEFIINNAIKIHPMALIKYNELKDNKAKKIIDKLTINYKRKEDYFIEKLAHAVATIAAAFYPKDVIVRMSDFKSNEYANLIGGKQFEPNEENPMLGFRGASRYYHEMYKEGFKLECAAMKIVREEMGLSNVKLMIPFCRTVEEGKKVVSLMEEHGLKRGEKGLEIYVMVEIPANVILAEEFARVFDGFSIGSNDLTQLVLGLDRDSSLISNLFNERNDAVKKMISNVIQSARKTNTKIGLCGQAPSDHSDFCNFLVSEGINSISFNPDALLQGINNTILAEEFKYLQEMPVNLETFD